MTQHQRSHGRFLPTYATLVGLPALALLVILCVGNAVVSKDGTRTTAVTLVLRTMALFATLTIVPISQVGRWFLRLFGRGGA